MSNLYGGLDEEQDVYNDLDDIQIAKLKQVEEFQLDELKKPEALPERKSKVTSNKPVQRAGDGDKADGKRVKRQWCVLYLVCAVLMVLLLLIFIGLSIGLAVRSNQRKSDLTDLERRLASLEMESAGGATVTALVSDNVQDLNSSFSELINRYYGDLNQYISEDNQTRELISSTALEFTNSIEQLRSEIADQQEENTNNISNLDAAIEEVDFTSTFLFSNLSYQIDELSSQTMQNLSALSSSLNSTQINLATLTSMSQQLSTDVQRALTDSATNLQTISQVSNLLNDLSVQTLQDVSELSRSLSTTQINLAILTSTSQRLSADVQQALTNSATNSQTISQVSNSLNSLSVQTLQSLSTLTNNLNSVQGSATELAASIVSLNQEAANLRVADQTITATFNGRVEQLEAEDAELVNSLASLQSLVGASNEQLTDQASRVARLEQGQEDLANQILGVQNVISDLNRVISRLG